MSWPAGYIYRLFNHFQLVSRPSTSPAAHGQQESKLSTCWLLFWHPNHYTNKIPKVHKFSSASYEVTSGHSAEIFITHIALERMTCDTAHILCFAYQSIMWFIVAHYLLILFFAGEQLVLFVITVFSKLCDKWLFEIQSWFVFDGYLLSNVTIICLLIVI